METYCNVQFERIIKELRTAKRNGDYFIITDEIVFNNTRKRLEYLGYVIRDLPKTPTEFQTKIYIKI